jgi:hypothetical protein
MVMVILTVVPWANADDEGVITTIRLPHRRE